MARVGVAQGLVLRAFVTVAVVATFVVVPARAAEPECVDTQPTAQAAVEMASRCGHRVEIVELRSENSQTFAKPGGSWARIDTALQVAGTKVAPVAAVLPVEFSAVAMGLRRGRANLLP